MGRSLGGERHFYPDADRRSDHTTDGNCPCKPERRIKHKARGRQGYDVEVSYDHKPLQAKAEELAR